MAEVTINDSILTSIKKQLGPTEGDNYFDPNIILLINSALSRLNTLGVGPEKPFRITGDTEAWSDFISEETFNPMIPEYVFLRVKLVFDPPTSSYVQTAFQERLEELGWLLEVFRDNTDSEEV